MNNYQKHLKQIRELTYRPTLLLHVCCGVCSVYPLLYLSSYFDITVYFPIPI
ncbi:MAG: epoxyqueuosine reductase QueH, partial [Erysipelotrichaceae bacterium]|nr:epoxyqueuosine reductase QueH [Erysipelotrichaceae bacterium]